MEVSGRTYNNQTTYIGRQRRILCQPCKCDGDTKEAEAFCETCNEFICTPCLKVHRKLAISKNHVIKSKEEMPISRKKQKDPCSELCSVHHTEIIKFYCENHHSVGCGDCMVLNHKTCSVKLVNDVSDSYDTSEECMQIKEKMGILLSKISSYQGNIVAGINAADKMREKIIKDIHIFRQEINEYLDNAAANLLKRIDQLKSKQMSQLGHMQKEFESMETEMREFQDKIINTSDKINQLFVVAKLAHERIEACQITTKELASKCEIEIFDFVKSQELEKIVTGNLPIGVINERKWNFQRLNRGRLRNNDVDMIRYVSCV